MGAYEPTTPAGRAMRALVEDTAALVRDSRVRMALDLARPMLGRGYEAVDRDPARVRAEIIPILRQAAATLGLSAADIFPAGKGRGAA
ncbi:MAG: hypothetical protein EPO65_07635 [Dehalococcoidia bacterium]|nr:MAG: hypothetical protein EPO65_07635 [Dehalococcoidia bacterium]